MRRSSILVVVIVILLGAFAMSIWMGSKRYQDVVARQVAERLRSGENLIIIDVREPHEFAAGHIPGAINIPLGELRAHLDRFSPEAEIFLVCRSGVRSAEAARIMAGSGFRRIRNIQDGMLGWEGPIAK